jgi:hypothetical protein
MFETLGISRDPREFQTRKVFCEEFFGLLGAEEIESFDVSDYQGATHIQDMNEPIPAAFHERYSCVHDGGTIEHVFNLPQALKNCLQMVRLGGHFTQVNAANNFMGHGFWQFSPEMIYRSLSPENGFDVRAVLLHEAIPGGAWHLVADPAKVGGRVQLCNSQPTYILTIARRTAIKEIFASPPQQSDYVVEWSGGNKAAPRAETVRRSVTERVLGRVRREFEGIQKLLTRAPAYDPLHYRKLSAEQVWLGDF